MVTWIVVLRTLIEVAGLALLGQGVLFLLAGANREQNVFYRVLTTLTKPVWRAVRFITPRFVVDRHIGFLAFLLLLTGWYWLVTAQAKECREELGHPLCQRLQQEYVKRCESGSLEACDVLRRQAPPREVVSP